MNDWSDLKLYGADFAFASLWLGFVLCLVWFVYDPTLERKPPIIIHVVIQKETTPSPEVK